MGRYYNGDIKGKFWFAVQSSNDADFFGVQGYEPGELRYSYTKDEIPKIQEGIQKCNEKLVDYKEKLNKFFEEHKVYNDVELADSLGLSELNEKKNRSDGSEYIIGNPKVKELLEWYARLDLGEKILACVLVKGECNFTAEI